MLHQFQCRREGSLFYYQHGNDWVPSIVGFCPVCGCESVRFTGRVFDSVDEHRAVDFEADDWSDEEDEEEVCHDSR